MLGLALALEEQPEKSEVMKQRSNEVTTKSEMWRNLAGAQSWSKLARWSIGDFAEDRRAACAGCRREIGWALVECFVSHQGEGEGFLGGGRDAEVVGGDDLDGVRRKPFDVACSWHFAD